MKKLKVFFLDWYDPILPGSSTDNILIWLLKRNYDVEIDSINPDVLFYGLCFNKHLEYKNCLKIFVTGEPGWWSPELLNSYNPKDRSRKSVDDADYVMISNKIDDKKYYYFPNGLLWCYHHVYVSKLVDSFDFFTRSKSLVNDDIKNKKFCSFIYTNVNPVKRKEIFWKLNSYKRVDSNLYNRNIYIDSYINGGSVTKIRKASEYKFSFAMSNHYYKDNNLGFNLPGFVDEKMFESFFSGSLPLFYGNDEITDIFNEKSFVNWHTYNNDDDFINKIIELDNNDDLYLEYINQPPILNLDKLKFDETAEFLKNIIG